jgi:MFS transporter, AAHS family, 3-hydroxyphenylpropionic acid transporter
MSVNREGRARPIVIGLCFLVAVLEGFDLQVIGMAAPQLRKALSLSPEQMGWAFSASLIGLAIGAVFGGWLADRVGRKPVLIWSVVGLGLFTLATAFVSDFPTLFVVRFAAGLALGGAMPNLIAIVSEAAVKGRITTSVALMFCGMPLGGVIVALAARFAAADLGWQSLFVMGGVLPLIAAPLLMWGLAETRSKPAADAVRPAYLSTLFGKGRAATTLLLWFVFMLTLLLLSLLLNWTPSLIIAKGFEPSQAFYASMLLNLGSIIGSFTIGWFCDRIGVRTPMIFIYVGMAVILYLLSQAQTAGILLLLAFFAGFFVLGAQFALYGLAPRLYEPQSRGAGVGAAVAAGRLGAIVGPLVAGQLIGSGASGDEVVLVMAPIALLALAGLIALTVTAGSRLGSQHPATAPAH